jgi:DNA-binding transcriptional ArsR family regulator
MEDASRAWTFLTNHAAVLVCIYRGTVLRGAPVRVRDIAADVGVNERTVQNVLRDLEASGYIIRQRVGNRTHYRIHADLPLRGPADQDVAVGTLLDILTDDPDRVGWDGEHLGGPSGLIAAGDVAADGIQRALTVMRAHLGLDVAFVSHVRDGRRIFTHVDTASDPAPIKVGGSDPADDSYCHYVIRGEVPQLLVDPARHPVTSRLPGTRTVPVGTHLSVPIELAGGDVYGTCCCFSYDVREHVDERDLAAVGMVAQLVASQLEPGPTKLG